MQVLPPSVSSFRDRHGKERYRFRRNGVSRYINAEPGSDEFFDAVDACVKEVESLPWANRTPRQKAARNAALLARRRRADGEIYFISDGKGHIKIGFAVEAKKRLSTLQCGHPDSLSIVATMPGNRHVEKGLHTRFRKEHVRGEWFKNSGELATFLLRMANPAKVSQS